MGPIELLGVLDPAHGRYFAHAWFRPTLPWRELSRGSGSVMSLLFTSPTFPSQLWTINEIMAHHLEVLMGKSGAIQKNWIYLRWWARSHFLRERQVAIGRFD